MTGESRTFAVIRRVFHGYRFVAVYFLSALLLMSGLEMAARTALGLYEGHRTDPRSKLAIYETEPWNTQYWRELDEATKSAQYRDYVGWRAQPYQGQLINVDPDGLRVTSGADCRPGALKAFLFGGSTMWGVGAPDHSTIPAYVQNLLVARNPSRPICVVNYAQLAAVSSQGVIALEEELKRGRVPEIVIFYDGANDVLASYQAGKAGGVQYASRFRDHFEDKEPLAWRLYNDFASFHILASLAQKLRGGSGFSWTYTSGGTDTDELARETADLYLRNVRVVSLLAESFGFAAHFFWQPLVFSGNKTLTPEEARYRDGMEAGLLSLYGRTYALMAEAAAKSLHLHYLADIFDPIRDQLFTDYVHVSPRANRIVAEQMVTRLELWQQRPND